MDGLLSKKGVNVFDISLFDLEGITIIDSKALTSIGFRYIEGIGNLFPLILLEAKKRKLSLAVTINDLFHILNGSKPYKEWIDPEKIKPQWIYGLVDELGRYSKIYKVKIIITEQFFSKKYVEVIAKAAERNTIQYLKYGGDFEGKSSIFSSEDYATYPINPLQNPNDKNYLWSLSAWGSSSGLLGYSNMVFGLANRYKKKAVLTAGGWGLVPGCQINIALYRTIQFRPTLYCFCAAFYNEEPYENKQDSLFINNTNYKKSLFPLIKKFRKKMMKKEIANLILDLPNLSSSGKNVNICRSSLLSSIEAITNAITASGRELQVSVGEPVKEASIYYIFTSGSSPKFNLYRDISSSLFPIFTGDKQVYLQCALGLPRGPNWRKVSHYFGIPVVNNPKTCKVKEFLTSPIPLRGNFLFPNGEFLVMFRGYDFSIDKKEYAGRLSKFHHFTEISIKDIYSNAKIRSFAHGNRKILPLLIQNKNYFFITTNFLHFNYSNILCNLMGKPVFYKPSPIYLTTGKKQSAFFAASDTSVDLKIPQSKTSKIYHWKADGKQYQNSSVSYKDGRVQGNIKKWELVIIE